MIDLDARLEDIW